MNYTDQITINALCTNDRWFNNTLKAVLFSKRSTGIKNAQILSSKPFEHPEVSCILIDKIDSLEEYNEFMVKKYNDYLFTDFLLNIHDDGFVINPEVWTNDFLSYDYIGALWGVGHHQPPVTEYDRCGNGGFSLRSKKFLEVAQKYCTIMPNTPEDVLCCRIHRNIFIYNNIKYAPNELAVKFSVEDTSIPECQGQSHMNYKTITSFGFHMKNSSACTLLESVKI
jgi:hypothetical protein